jgi:hypothetical protein
MPYSIKGLRNVKEYSRAHSFNFKRLFNDVSDTMYLVSSWMVISEFKIDVLSADDFR